LSAYADCRGASRLAGYFYRPGQMVLIYIRRL
jgi:hypothetical protein